MAHITIRSNSNPLYDIIQPYIQDIEKLTPIELFDKVKILINGNWIGIVDKPYDLYLFLLKKKSQAIINIYTSIVFDYNNKEIRVCNEAGRPTRPLLRVIDNKLVITPSIVEKIKIKV